MRAKRCSIHVNAKESGLREGFMPIRHCQSVQSLVIKKSNCCTRGNSDAHLGLILDQIISVLYVLVSHHEPKGLDFHTYDTVTLSLPPEKEADDNFMLWFPSECTLKPQENHIMDLNLFFSQESPRASVASRLRHLYRGCVSRPIICSPKCLN